MRVTVLNPGRPFAAQELIESRRCRRLGNNRTEGLVKSGNLRRLESETLIEANSAQGSPVGAAERHLGTRRPGNSDLRRHSLLPRGAGRNRNETEVIRIDHAIVSDPGRNEQMWRQLQGVIRV